MTSTGNTRMHLLLACVLLVLTVATARSADISFYVGQWNLDGWYDATQFDDVDQIISEAGKNFNDIQQFDDEQFPAFEAWINANMSDNEVDIIWLNGCIPSVLYPFPNLNPDGSLAEDWLDNGNMFINVGDWFAYVSYECDGARCADNGSSGAANILDLNPSIIAFANDGALQPTPTGETYMPSLGVDVDVSTDRPIIAAEVGSPWEVAGAFATNNGKESGDRLDPVVLRNTDTNGYLAIINQKVGPATWIHRGTAVVEFINNWVVENVEGYLAVAATGKLTTTWGRLKQ